MTMSQEQIRDYCKTYLEATACQFLEKSPYHVTVKLSPQADKELTNRPYYWGFVERMGIEPETMSFCFIFDPEKYRELEGSSSAPTAGTTDPVLDRHFGAVRPLPVLGPGRIQKEEITFGSPRLKQIFAAARQGGRQVYLFENPGRLQRSTLLSAAYEPWLGVQYKLEFCCDVKREELHFLGISLRNGMIDDAFANRLAGKELTPRLPENVHISPTELALPVARERLENLITSRLEAADNTWADAAQDRLEEEQQLIDGYYKDLLQDPDEERQRAFQEQYEARKEEIRWQYEPRIVVSALGSGIFHLRSSL